MNTLLLPWCTPSTPLHCWCTFLRSSLSPGPSPVTSAIISAWLWRNVFKSTGHCTERPHWSTFAWHRDWRSQSAYHGPGDGPTLVYRWDRAGWLWLIDGLSLKHRGITKPSPLVYECVWVCASQCVCGGKGTGGQLYTNYPAHLECGDRYESGCQCGPSYIFRAWQN